MDGATSRSAGDIVNDFYAAVISRDLTAARTHLRDDLLFFGLFETYSSADEYMAALTKLLEITVRIDLKKTIAQADDAAIFFELETVAPAAATTLVAEWHEIKEGKIARVRSAFDGRPFDAMFAERGE